MPDSLTEMITAQSYRFKGYLVEPHRGLWETHKERSVGVTWTFFAIKDEVVLVNC